MKEIRRLVVVVPAVVLVGLLVWLYATRGAMEELAFLRRGSVQTGVVDQTAEQTAQTLAGLAVSSEEQAYAQQAERLSEHDVDQGFAMALRQASMQQRVPTGAAAETAKKVDVLKGMVKDDQTRVDGLTAAAKTAGTQAAEGDDLDVAKAQLGLDQDELADATADLARESGDRRGEIQQELTSRQNAMKAGTGAKETAVVAAKKYAALWGRGSAWFEQRSRAALIGQAEAKARAEAKALGAQHDALERQNVAAAGKMGTGMETRGAAAAAAATGVLAGSARVAALKTLAGQRVVMSILDDRVQTDGQLAEVYARWQTQVWVQHRIVGHLVLQSLAWIAFIVLAAALAGLFGRMVLHRVATDARRARTLETILMLGVEVVALAAVALVIFGVPQQMPTILGLAGAGLTVVFQDFILAFFGWFVLMGKNGIRVCDWVEIDSVGGEVTEIGLFRTTVLETGNWTSRGHPTGRRVTFTNSFAIRGQYFNYSTHGQWMWDEIKLNVPATADAYELIRKMQSAVDGETEQNTEQAEREWQTATKQNGMSQFSAKPTVDLRPAASGVDVIVRFVTRAGERFEVRNRIYDALLKLMEMTEKPALGDGSAAGASTNAPAGT